MTTWAHAMYRGHDLLTTRADAVRCAEQNPDLAYYYMTAPGEPVFRVQVWEGRLREVEAELWHAQFNGLR